MKSKLLFFIVILIFSLISCQYFDEGTTLNVSTFETNIEGLPAIPDSMTYVGWFERFDSDNNIQYFVKVFVQDASSSGSINYKSDKSLKSVQQAQQFWLTAEKRTLVNDSDFTPSSRIMLEGSFSYAATSLYISNNQESLDTSRAVFSLATPTDSSLKNGLSGVWFVDSISTKPVTGLNLPDLYGGWIYEGWVEINGQYLSTGRFSNPSAKDLYSEFGGGLAGFNFPGEDFLQDAPAGFTFPLNLSNAKVVVSIEYNDGKTHGIKPFLKIFEATIPASPQSGEPYTLQYSNPVLPGGNSTIFVDIVK